MVSRHGRTLGGCRWRGARRGQRCVPLHGNPPLMVPGVGRPVLRGVAVAVMLRIASRGAWSVAGTAGRREKAGGRVCGSPADSI